MKPNLERPILYLITKGELTPVNFSEKISEVLEVVEAAVQEGVNLVQIREKALEGRQLFEIVKAAVEIVSGSDTLILVNERFDVALAANAHGVHLPASALSASIVRNYVPVSFLIGVSTHNYGEVELAVEEGADLVVFGPVFSSPGKGSPVGVSELQRACHAIPDIPVLALGGVDETNIDSVIDAGAAGIAAIRLLNDRESLAGIAERVKRRKFR